MKKILLGLGLALGLGLSGCTPSTTEAPATPATTSTSTTSQRAMNDEVATVDLTETGRMDKEDLDPGRSVLPGDGGVSLAPGGTGAMSPDGNDGMVARTDEGLPDQNDVASRGTDKNADTAMSTEMTALEGNQAEQQLSALALERSKNAKVIEAAKMIQTDHKKAENQLREVVGSDLPAKVELNAEHKAMMAKLQDLNGAEFDKAFVDGMVKGHEKTLAFYQSQSKEASSEELKGYFAGNTRVIQQHLEHCRKLQQSMS